MMGTGSAGREYWYLELEGDRGRIVYLIQSSRVGCSDYICSSVGFVQVEIQWSEGGDIWETALSIS